jgi:PAS domain S-box-containing protein
MEAIETTREVNNLLDGKVLENKVLFYGLDMGELLKNVYFEFKPLLNSEMISFALLQDDVKGFQYHTLENGEDAKKLADHVISPKEESYLKRVMETGLPVVVSDISQIDPKLQQKIFGEETQSYLIFPLKIREKLIGTINFGSNRIGHFSEDHIQFLRQISPELAISIQNALVYGETKRKLDELGVLYEMTRISTSSLSLDLMLTEMVKCLNHFLRFEALGFFLIDESTKRLILHSSSIGPSFAIENIEPRLGKVMLEGVVGKGEALLSNPNGKDAGPRIFSEICVPLKTGEKVIGLIDAQRSELDSFSEGDLHLLKIVGERLATIIENVRSEERYRSVVESALDGVMVLGEDDRFTYVNERLVELLGFSREELLGRKFRDHLDEESRRWVEDRYARIQREEEVPCRYELRIIQKNREKRNVEISSTMIKDSEGNLNTISFLKDVTEKRRMEEQLLQSEKLRAVGEMASGIAHDFNNALAIILGNVQLLLYHTQDPGLRETLKTIERVAKDSAQTVRRLQDFTRKKGSEELFRLDLNAVIRDAIKITKPKWKDVVQGKGVHVEMVLNFEEVPPVSANASELREVITNMIFNAIEAMKEGGKIEIRTFRRKDKVYIQISDTGAGMSEEVQRKIFEPFFTTKPFTNTGLGLSMSYGIIKRFGGRIEVESKEGSGTTFTITLPVGIEGKEEVRESSSIKKSRPGRILVIDDEALVRSVLSQILSQAKHQVTVAENGENGIQLFGEKGFDIVLTDLGMPNMSGWEVCKAIKKISPHTPVGMITGWGMEVDQPNHVESRVDFIISKPFDFNQILNVVAETMESKVMSPLP